MRWPIILAIALAFASPASAQSRQLDVHGWQVVERNSGPVSYYTILSEEGMSFVRGAYRPGLETVVLAQELTDAERGRVRKIRWAWRALVLPEGGNDCVSGKGDSAATVYVTWKRGFRYYTLKYVWAAEGEPGTTCHRKRSPFVAQDTIVLRAGGPLRTWRSEEIDVQAEFRKHFEDGDESADVPDLGGVGIMTDGDQTNSPSAADYADFVISR